MTELRVALVNMPFAAAERPSIQCGLLKAAVQHAGYPTDVFYLNLELAAEIGATLYAAIAGRREDLLLGDWLFARSAFSSLDAEEEYRQVHGAALDSVCREIGVSFERLCALRRDELPAWIERWVEEVDWGRYGVVGFTSLFKQNTAALALAAAVKRRFPEVTTVFGGANFDAPMGREYVRALPFIDYAVEGEGDLVLPRLVDRIASGRSALDLGGVVGRDGDAVPVPKPPEPVEDLDSLPDPDYDDYFETLFRLGRKTVLGDKAPLLLFESARGCWWGQRQQCTFCGLNNDSIGFRSKRPEEAVAQLERLASRYKIVNFEAVDNIMDHRYLAGFCAPLSEQRYDYRLFYEVKSNLTAAQLKLLRQAGVTIIQPGIESLNSHVLSLMRKGVTMLRNVRLLKWAHYYGLHVGWNLLTGFPGETEEDYEEQLRVVSLLRHLPPPEGPGRLWLERFSPYFVDPSFPVHDVRPIRAYGFVYPEERLDLEAIAYFFDYEMDDTLASESHHELRVELETWRRAWSEAPRPALVYQRAPDWIQIVDRRNGEVKAHSAEGFAAKAYEFCGETDRTVAQVLRHLQTEDGNGVASRDVRDALEEFCDLGFMLQEDGRYLSLAQPANLNW